MNGYPANLTNVFAISGGGFHTLSVQAPYGLNITNTPPYWTNGLDSTTVTMGEQTTRVINNAALDLNAPPQLVFYSFATNAPPFASIDAFTGLITLSPLAGDGPSTNLIATVATDNGYPPLSATNRFTLIVTSTNVPPVPPFTNAVPVSGIIHTNLGGTNGFLLTWFAPSNALFQVQWTTSLFPATWMTFTNPPLVSYNPAFPASLTSATFNFFDDGSQTGGFGATRFYRLITVGTMPPPTNTVPISGIVLTNGQFRLTWLAPTNNQFNVRWATNLTPPITWTIFPGPVTSTTGTFTFTDTNAPLLMKFYQLILLP
ncbi:MAG: cadherin repeat domain-containing protein [Limisphaerales bacterium]